MFQWFQQHANIILGLRVSFVFSPVDIVVIDDAHINFFEYMLRKYSYVVILTHDKHRIFFKHRIFISWNYLFYLINFLRKTKSFKRSIYLSSLASLSPKVCLTYVDNSSLVGLISTYLPSIRTIAIQNGQRSCMGIAAPSLINETIDILFCYGHEEIEEYQKYNITVRDAFPFGSLKNSLFMAGNYVERHKYDLQSPCIVWVSQYRHKRFIEDHYTYKGYKKIGEYIMRLSKTLGLPVYVAMASSSDEPSDLQFETNWYSTHFQSQVNLVPNSREMLGTYATTEKASLCIGFVSTALREAFGRGKKTIFMNFTGRSEFDFPVSGPWRLVDPTFDEFLAAAKYLLNLDDEQYRRLSETTRKHVMNNNLTNPTHLVLERLISSIVRGDN